MFKPHNFIAKHAETFTNFVVEFRIFSYNKNLKKIPDSPFTLDSELLELCLFCSILFEKFSWGVRRITRRMRDTKSKTWTAVVILVKMKCIRNWKPRTCHHNYFPNLWIHVDEICCCCCCRKNEIKWNRLP